MKDESTRLDSLKAPLNPSGYATRLSVIERFQHGENSVEDEYYFFHKYRPLIIAIGKRSGLSDDNIKDLISRVFFTVFEEFKKISAGEKKEIKRGLQEDGRNFHFKAWLDKIIKNKINDIYRENGRRNIDDSVDAVAQADQQAVESGLDIDMLWQKFLLRESLHELKNTLSPIQFKIFFQVKMKGKKGPQVAQIFEQTPDNVNQICSRAMKELRRIIEALKIEHPLEKYAEDELCKYIDEADKEFQTLEDEFPAESPRV